MVVLSDKLKKVLEIIMSTDVYKVGHRTLYPPQTTKVFSNFTPRSGTKSGHKADFVIAYGMRFVVKLVQEEWKQFFLLRPEELKLVLAAYAETVQKIIGVPTFSMQHFADLHALGTLPLVFRGVTEGTKAKFKNPVLTIYNTDERFAWLVNYLETKISSELWPIITAATEAYHIKTELLHWAHKTGTDPQFVNFQVHDFVCRSVEGTHAAKLTGMGHLLFFDGSDNLPAILASNKGSSVIATEHSVMSAGTKAGEFETYRRLLTANPDGIISIVSDTWNIYQVLAHYLPQLKSLITQRSGKLVIRPDSGDPMQQLLGTSDATYLNMLAERAPKDQKILTWARLGLFKLVEKHFGYTMNAKGFKVLPIGFLWGEGMTFPKIQKVYQALMQAGYASENLIIGIGSNIYQRQTRDTYGFAMKATYVEVNGQGRSINKNPITDFGFKKSATGLLAIFKGELKENCSWAEVNDAANELQIIK